MPVTLEQEIIARAFAHRASLLGERDLLVRGAKAIQLRWALQDLVERGAGPPRPYGVQRLRRILGELEAKRLVRSHHHQGAVLYRPTTRLLDVGRRRLVSEPTGARGAA